MEQPDVATAPAATLVSIKLALSDEARASLAAVRVAQESARTRARRQTVRTRIWFAFVVAGMALAAVAFAPRLKRLRPFRAKAVTTATGAKPVPRAPASPAPRVPAPP